VDMTRLEALLAEAAIAAAALGGTAVPMADGVMLMLRADRQELGKPGRPPEPLRAEAVRAAVPALLAAMLERIGERR
jgi:hypothetical protein